MIVTYMARIVTKCWMPLHYEHVVDGRCYADLVLHSVWFRWSNPLHVVAIAIDRFHNSAARYIDNKEKRPCEYIDRLQSPCTGIYNHTHHPLVPRSLVVFPSPCYAFSKAGYPFVPEQGLVLVHKFEIPCALALFDTCYCPAQPPIAST